MRWSESSRLVVLREYARNENYSLHTDKTLIYWPEGRGGPSVKLLREGPEMLLRPPKILISDLDGVVNKPDTPPPAKYFLGFIVENNDYLRSKKDSVFEKFKMLEKADNPKPFAESLSDDFRKGELTKELYLDACDYAAENLSVTVNFNHAIRRLRNMGYRTFVLTASPRDLVVSLEKRLAIKAKYSETSEFHFGSNGVFRRMELNLDETRAAKRDRIMQHSVSTKYGLEIMMDDNWTTAKRIMKFGPNHVYFMLTKTEPMPNNITVEMQEARYDSNKIVERIKRLEKGIGVTIVLSERDHKRAIGLSQDAVHYGERALTSFGEGFEINMSRSVNSITEYSELMRGLFPGKKSRYAGI